MHLAIFAIGLLWLLAARVGAESAAEGITHLFGSDLFRPLLAALFLLILLLTGYTALNWVGQRNGSVRATNALPLRPTSFREWQKGAALGWALLLVCVLPTALVGDLHPQFWWTWRAWGLLLLSVVTVLVGSLATEVAFRGFLFQELIAVTGPGAAMVVLSAIYALSWTAIVNATRFSFLVSVLAGFLFSLSYLRTHGLWFGWGLRFGWLASMGILFGLPLGGSVDMASVIASDSSGRIWITGGAYGPQGALFTGFVLIAGMFAMYQMTRDYAWEYTHEPIVPAGYPMDVPPPAAHTAMERAAAPAAPPPLVQISGLSSTMAAAPAGVAPAEHVPEFTGEAVHPLTPAPAEKDALPTPRQADSDPSLR